jgi:hypothetical protein
MINIQYQNWDLLLSSHIEPLKAKALYDMVTNNEYKVVNVLKDNDRSIVKRIEIDGLDLVLKIPLDKNRRPWIRFLTWFRLGEAFRNLTGMQLLDDLDILSTKPILAAQYKTFGMVTNAWLLYQYIDGKRCFEQPDSYQGVVQTLQKMHSKNILHGDPQMRNFIKSGHDIYVIDSNPSKVTFIGFDFAYEWAYLRKSDPYIEPYIKMHMATRWYKFAAWYDRRSIYLSNLRKR